MLEIKKRRKKHIKLKIKYFKREGNGLNSRKATKPIMREVNIERERKAKCHQGKVTS